MKTEIGSYSGTPNRVVVESHYAQYVVMLPKAISAYLSYSGVDEHPMLINPQVQAGMIARFACRDVHSAEQEYDSSSHSYAWYLEGWYAMDRAIKVAAASCATPTKETS